MESFIPPREYTLHCIKKISWQSLEAPFAKLYPRFLKISRIDARFKFRDVRGLSRNFRDQIRDFLVLKTNRMVLLGACVASPIPILGEKMAFRSKFSVTCLVNVFI